MINKANFAGVIEKARKSAAQLQQDAAAPQVADRVGGVLEEVIKSLRELSAAGAELLSDNQLLEAKVKGLATESERYQHLFDSVPDAYVVAALDGTVREANRAAREVFGFEPRDRAALSLYDFVHADEQQAFRDCLQRSLSGEDVSLCTVVMYARGGRPLPVQVTMAPIRIGAEISAVRMTFRDLTDREEDQHKLQARESRYRTLVETAPAVIIGVNVNWSIVQWNAEAERVFGWSPHDALGDHFLTRCVPEEVRPSVESQLSAAFRGQTRRFESHIRPRDGNVRIMLWCAAPLPRVDDESPELTMCGLDITDRREAAHQRLLVAEIQHRVKNNLATVLAIADQTIANSGTLDDFKDAFRGRVIALAQMHTLLTQRNLQGVPLRMLVMQSLSPYVAAGGPHVELKADPILLSAKGGQCFSIALHELATNAAKYGALTTHAGRVEVRVELQSQKTPPVFALTWTERGGPAVRPPAKHGLGTELIKQVIGYELQGQARLVYEPAGLRCEIEVPWTPMIGAIDREEGAASIEAEHAVPAEILAGRRVLLVEDNALVADELRHMLDELGCRVIGPAATLEHAVDLVRSERLDAVLLDVDLGGYEVWPLADELLDLDIPFVLTTGLACPQSLPPEFRDSSYLEKPFDQHQLAEKIAEAVSGMIARRH